MSVVPKIISLWICDMFVKRSESLMLLSGSYFNKSCIPGIFLKSEILVSHPGHTGR